MLQKASVCCQKRRYFWFQWSNRPLQQVLISSTAHLFVEEGRMQKTTPVAVKGMQARRNEDENDGAIALHRHML